MPRTLASISDETVILVTCDCLLGVEPESTVCFIG